MNGYTENEYEQALIELFQSLEDGQYRYVYGPDIERDYSNPLLDDVLQESLQRIMEHMYKLLPHATEKQIRKMIE